MQPLTVRALRTAARSFPTGTGLGCDNIAPRACERLSDEASAALAMIFSLAEETGRWPKAIDLTLIVLLPKLDGGRRPIRLFPTPIRLWMKARTGMPREWEADSPNEALYGGAGKGAQRAAWIGAFHAETARANGRSHAQALIDLVKAFEMTPHQKLIDAAISREYPFKLLRLSLAAYRLKRVVGYRGLFAECARATRGITAGSSFATTELRVLLIDLVAAIQHTWPPSSGVQCVDDLTIMASGSDKEVEEKPTESPPLLPTYLKKCSSYGSPRRNW